MSSSGPVSRVREGAARLVSGASSEVRILVGSLVLLTASVIAMSVDWRFGIVLTVPLSIVVVLRIAAALRPEPLDEAGADGIERMLRESAWTDAAPGADFELVRAQLVAGLRRVGSRFPGRLGPAVEPTDHAALAGASQSL